MSTLPKITIIQTNGNLGRKTASEDGVSGIIVSGVAVALKFALGQVLGPFYQPSDAEALGIDAAYDIANKSMAYHHISDFFLNAVAGSELYVLVVANTVTMTEMADKTLTHAKAMIVATRGRLKLLSLSRVPAIESEIVEGLDGDVYTAIPKAQALAEEAFGDFRPLSIFIEGRNWSGVVADLKDLRNKTTGGNANRVSVVLSSNNSTDYLNVDEFEPSANVGFVMGAAAALPVQRNIGRVKNGALPIDAPGFSGNFALEHISEADREILNAKGYIFLRQHVGKAGYFFNDDHAACPIDDDYAYLNRGRVIDKAARLAREVYIEELLDDVDVDPATGKLSAEVVKAFQSKMERSININMTTLGECSGVTVYVDPDQNILANDLIEVELGIIPKGMVREVKVKLGFKNPSSQS